MLGKIKAFFKWYGEGIMGFSGPKPEAKAAEKKAAPETKVEAAENKGDESSSK